MLAGSWLIKVIEDAGITEHILMCFNGDMSCLCLVSGQGTSGQILDHRFEYWAFLLFSLNVHRRVDCKNCVLKDMIFFIF